MANNLTVTATLKSWGGSYNTHDYKFEDQEAYDKWFDKHNSDHKLGKIIGILKIVKHE